MTTTLMIFAAEPLRASESSQEEQIHVSHGAAFAPDFKKQIADVYGLLYGAKLTDEQVKAILESDSNAPADQYVDIFS